jgi:hypothetical protein
MKKWDIRHQYFVGQVKDCRSKKVTAEFFIKMHCAPPCKRRKYKPIPINQWIRPVNIAYRKEITNTEQSLVDHWLYSPMEMCHLAKTFVGPEKILILKFSRIMCHCNFKDCFAVFHFSFVTIINPKTCKSHRQECKWDVGTRKRENTQWGWENSCKRPFVARQWKDCLIYGTRECKIFVVQPFTKTPPSVLLDVKASEINQLFDMDCVANLLCVVGQFNTPIYVYDLNTLSCIKKIEHIHEQWIHFLSPQRLFSKSCYRTGFLIDLSTLQCSIVSHKHGIPYKQDLYHIDGTVLKNESKTEAINLNLPKTDYLLMNINDFMIVAKRARNTKYLLYNRYDNIYSKVETNTCVKTSHILDDVLITCERNIVTFYK